MALPSLHNWLGGTPRKPYRKSRGRPSKLALALEHLEDRTTPAAVSWDGGAGTLNWFHAANWSNDVLPTLADDVTISAATGGVEINDTFGTAVAGTLTSSSDLRVISGTLQLAGDSHVSGDFTLAGVTFGGVVTGSGTLTLSGDVTWGVNGVMAGTGKTVLTGTSTLAGSTFGSIRENRVLENAGDATLLAGNSFTFRDNTVFRNLAGATLTVESGAGFGTFFQGPASRFVNEGAVHITGPGTTTIGVFTENSGTLDIDGASVNLTGLKNSGTVDAAGGNLTTGNPAAGMSFENTSTVSLSAGTLNAGTGTSSGAIRLADGATLTLVNTTFVPPFTLLDGATVTGGPIVVGTFQQLAASGRVEVDAVRLTGGTLTVLAGGDLTTGTLEHNGTVTGPGTVTVTDRWTFTNGSLTGTGRLVTEGTSTLSGGFFATIDNRTVENAGAALVDVGASFTFANGGNWTNLPGSVFEVRTNSFVDTFFTGPTARFLNRGTVLKTGTGAATIELPVVNEAGGTVRVAQGNLLLTGGVTNAGNIDVASGAALRLTGNNNTLQAGGTSTGAGEIQLAGNLTVAGDSALGSLKVESGTVTANAPLTIDSLNLNGTLAGTSPITVGNLTLVNGTVNTALNLGDLTFTSGSLSGTGNVTVNGTFNWSGGSQSGSGNLTVNGPLNWSSGTLSRTGTMTVNGAFNWTGGTMSGTGRTILNGTTTISGAPSASGRQIENAGTATVASGAVNLGGNARWTNLPGGVFEVRGGEVFGSFASGQFFNQGTVRKTTANTAVFRLPLTNQAGGVIDIREGTLQLFGNNNSLFGNSDIAAGATLAISAATTAQAGATVTGAGELFVGGTTLTVAGPLSVSNFRTQGGTTTLNGALTVGNFTHSGTLTGAGDLTVNGNLNWIGGSLSGTGRTFLNGTTTVNGSVIADNRPFENAGSATVATGGISFRNAAKWTNLPGSVFEVRAGDPVSVFFGNGQFINRGTILKTTTGTANIGMPVINQSGGVIDVDEGALRLVASSASSAGTFDVAGGANLTIGSGSGTFTLLAGAAGIGAGEVMIAGAPVVVSGAASLTNLRQQGGTLTVNAPLALGNYTFSGTLNGTSDVTVNGTFAWTGGGMSGTGKTILNGTGTIGGNTSVLPLDGRTIDNAGTVTVTTSSTVPFQFRGNAVWNNLPGSLLVLPGTATMSQFFASATSAVNNAGTIRKTGAAGNVSQIAIPLINSGRVEILGGDLNTGPNTRNSGVVDVAANARWVTTNNGTTFLDAGATVTGAGLMLMQNNLTVTGAAGIARLQQTASTLTTNAPLTIGDYLFSGGTLTGTGRTTLTGNSSFAGTATKVISAHTVDNAGTVTWSQTGTIQMANGAVFNNLAGALFDVANDAQLVASGGTTAFNNAGTVRKSVGGGPIFPAFGPSTRWGVPLNNSGLLDIRAGNFQPVPPFGLPATVPMLNNTGTIQVGTTTSSAASLVLPVVPGTSGLPTYTLAGGTLTGTGQIGLPGPTSPLIVAPGATLGGTLTVWGSVVNRGTVQPGTTAGTLTVMGDYTQVDDATADGRLVIGLRGDSGSGLFGKLLVNGRSFLAGALEVFADGGFLPDFGDVFQVFRSVGPRTGDFTYPAGGYDLDGYRVLTPEYAVGGLRLNLVTEAGELPVIDPIDDVTVNEGQTVSFTATVSGEEPPGPLTFSLAPGSSAGATIDPVTGAFSFLAAAGPGEYVFQIAAHDPNAPTDPFDVETFKVTVRNVAPAVTLTGGDPTLNEGDEFTADGSFTDPGADAWTATVDYGDGTGATPLALNPDKTFALAHHYRDNGNYTVTVRVFDGHEYGTATFDVTVANLTPTVVAADDQSADEGTLREFDLGSFTDFGVSDSPWTVSVNWGDGSAPVVFQTMDQGLLASLAHTYADSGAYTVTVTVTDKDGASASDTFQVAVANLAPVAGVTGPATGVRGQVRTFTLAATDASAVDQAAGFTFLINWGDGTTQEVTGTSGTTVEHTYTDAGDYTVSVTATDKDGGVSDATTHALSVVVAEVQDGVLVVGGTTGADAIQVKKGAGDGTSLEVIVNGVNLGEFGGLTRAVVYGQSGDDDLDATGSTDVGLELYGGGGNDHLKGGSKDDILDGGSGDDELLGGLGRDVLVGGSGSDRIVSQSGDDILIGGRFLGNDDLTVARRAALLSVAEDWSSGDSFADRVATLSPYLAPLVGDDGVTDYLTGSAGNDWYFARTVGEPGGIDVLAGNSSQDIVAPI